MAINCCSTIDDYASLGCLIGHGARVSAIALVSKCFQNEFSAPYDNAFWAAPATWAALINGTIPATQQYATIIDNFRGEQTSEKVTSEGFGRQNEDVTGWNFAVTGNVVWSDTNQDFFASVNGSRDFWLVYAIEDKIFVSAVPVSPAVAPIVSANVNEKALWQVEFTWSTSVANFPFGYDKPAGYFE